MSFLIGSLIVTGAPFLLLPDTPQGPDDVSRAVAGCLAIALTAAGFCFVGVAGNHMKRSRPTRALGGVLLAFPIGGSVWVLQLDRPPEHIWAIGPLLFCAVLLFYSFVFPGMRAHLHPRMRPRDPDAGANANANA